MQSQRKPSEDVLEKSVTSSKQTTSNDHHPRCSKFKSLKSLPNSFRLNRRPTNVNTIIESEANCEIPLIAPTIKRNSMFQNETKNKFEKSNTTLPPQSQTFTKPNGNMQHQSTFKRLNTNNEISYKERKLIRQSTGNAKINMQHTLKDNDYQDTFTQATQYKSFQTGYMTTESSEGCQSTMPPFQTHLDLLNESDEECELTPIREREKIQKKHQLLRLMKTNPYQSLKHNVYYNYRKNQMEYKKYLKPKPILNACKSKEEGALYKVNELSTLYITSKPNRPNIILRLLARKSQMAPEFKTVIFWKGIEWLWKNFFGQIEKLLVSFQNYKWFLEKEKLISLKTVEEFFLLIQLKKYKEFIDALFLIFDESNAQRINLKFALTVLITTKKISYYEQMKETIEVWESGKSGRINCSEINEIIRSLFSRNKDIKTLLTIIKNTFDIQDWRSDTVNKIDLLNLFLNDHKIPVLMRRNRVDIDEIDQIFKEEILNLFNINMRNSKMSLETHDAQKFCENDINKYEKVLATLAHRENDRDRRRLERINLDGNISDD